MRSTHVVVTGRPSASVVVTAAVVAVVRVRVVVGVVVVTPAAGPVTRLLHVSASARREVDCCAQGIGDGVTVEVGSERSDNGVTVEPLGHAIRVDLYVSGGLNCRRDD